MTRSALDLLFRVMGPLAMLPQLAPRRQGTPDPDWRDQLLAVSRGHCTGWMKSTYLADPAVEHQLQVYHAGPFLTPPSRSNPAQDLLFCGWKVTITSRQALSS